MPVVVFGVDDCFCCVTGTGTTPFTGTGTGTGTGGAPILTNCCPQAIPRSLTGLIQNAGCPDECMEVAEGSLPLTFEQANNWWTGSKLAEGHTLVFRVRCKFVGVEWLWVWTYICDGITRWIDKVFPEQQCSPFQLNDNDLGESTCCCCLFHFSVLL